ncbi:SCA7-domain-containing protein [Rickenella mellea]|uniref:SCA7-domain-containing protein n=1 Tax=Rickenella mellea TaxID=50990 RepID=A0A4Y7QBA6_9AGAM|nr:SCA7-domain-containing protein [Rickenella mellea]
MALKLKPPNTPSPSIPFSWDTLPSSPSLPPTSPPDSAPSPPTSWLSAKDMKIFGAETLRTEVGIVKCKECEKPVLKSAVFEHAENCRNIRSGAQKKGAKGKATADAEDAKKGKKRKADEEEPGEEGGKKKNKPATKVTKGRFKGPVDYDRQCGVINDKNLPCSRSLTCKTHSMGAKRAVQGRSKGYDELLLDWNREHNPNWVEPVKRETKAEKKEKKEREKAEKKRLAGEAAAATQAAKGTGGSPAKKGKKAATALVPVATVEDVEEEDMDDVDSEAEIDSLVKAVKSAQTIGVIGVPLAVPYDAGSFFVARRERLRNCKDLLASAFASRGGIGGGGAGRMV